MNLSANGTASRWLRYGLLILLGEKVIWHLFVSLARSFDWMNIASTVAVDPTILVVLGLVLGLALFDVVGEFVAQVTFAIAMTVSFLVAITPLLLTLLYRHWAAQSERNAA